MIDLVQVTKLKSTPVTTVRLNGDRYRISSPSEITIFEVEGFSGLKFVYSGRIHASTKRALDRIARPLGDVTESTRSSTKEEYAFLIPSNCRIQLRNYNDKS